MDFRELIFDPGINLLGFCFFPRLIILVTWNPESPPHLGCMCQFLYLFCENGSDMLSCHTITKPGTKPITYCNRWKNYNFVWIVAFCVWILILSSELFKTAEDAVLELACVASVSAQVRRESWDESKKEGMRDDSTGNACYVGYVRSNSPVLSLP